MDNTVLKTFKKIVNRKRSGSRMSSLQVKYNVSWVQFEVNNSNTQSAFEGMCRLLFNRHFFNNKALLHSNPNNPGIEVLPILESASNKKLAFKLNIFHHSIIHK